MVYLGMSWIIFLIRIEVGRFVSFFPIHHYNITFFCIAYAVLSYFLCCDFVDCRLRALNIIRTSHSWSVVLAFRELKDVTLLLLCRCQNTLQRGNHHQGEMLLCFRQATMHLKAYVVSLHVIVKCWQ